MGKYDVHNLLGVLKWLHHLLGKVDEEALLENFGVANDFLPEFQQEDHLSCLICLKYA